MRVPLKLMLSSTSNAGFSVVGSGLVVGFGVGSGEGFFTTMPVESPRITIYVIAIADRPITKTMARIHGNGLRLRPDGSSSTRGRY